MHLFIMLDITTLIYVRWSSPSSFKWYFAWILHVEVRMIGAYIAGLAPSLQGVVNRC